VSAVDFPDHTRGITVLPAGAMSQSDYPDWTEVVQVQTGGSLGAAAVGDPTLPTGAIASTVPRWAATGVEGTPAATEWYASAIWLAAGTKVSSISYFNNSVGQTQNHCWFALCDNNRNMLAVSADLQNTAWPISTMRTLAIATTAAGAATSFTTTHTGMYYVANFMGSVPATPAATNAKGPIFGVVAPVIAGYTGVTNLTAVPAFPYQLGALTSDYVQWAVVS
jgi:hypothetical protein